MPRKPRIAIAGAGQMGRAHAEAFRACGAEVVAVVDRDSERARRLAAACGAAALATVDEALREGPDALSVCLPHSLHFEAAMAAAARRVALLIEKPHCTSLQESRELRAACARHGVLAMAGFTHRFLATSLRLKSCIDAGLLGRVELVVDRLVANSLGDHAPAWYRDRALAGGGIAMIGMIHSIDRLRWLLQAEVTEVLARTRPPVSSSEVEDTALAILSFSNGTQASLVAHRSPVAGHERAHRCEVLGRNLNAYCSLGSFAHQELEFVGPAGGGRVVVTDDRPFVTEVREFLSALAAGRAASPDLDDAEVALGVVLAIYEAERTRRPIILREFLGAAPGSRT
jgi:predicted dehydrogenase